MAEVFVMEIPPRLDNPDLISTIKDLNNQLCDMCKSSDRLHFIAQGITTDDLCWDHLHLSSKGTHKLVSSIRRALIPGYVPPSRNTYRPPDQHG
jgi:hypothetical protein